MRKKGLILAVMAALMLAGCKRSEWPEPLPTEAPQITEAEREEMTEGKNLSEGLSALVSYVDQSRQAADENTLKTMKSAILIACVDAELSGMKFSEEPICFRCTKELEDLEGPYPLLKTALEDLWAGDGPPKLYAEGSYMVAEVSKGEDGSWNVEVTVEQE